MPCDRFALADYVVAHYEDMLSLYGVESGLRQARKHLGWYLEGQAPMASTELRKAVLTSTEPRIVVSTLRQALIDESAQPFREVA
jgi:tRNA-dihydrouridine synthase